MKKIILRNEYEEKLMKNILKREEEKLVMFDKKKKELTNVIQTVREFIQQIE